MDKPHISFIGAGKVATALCRQLSKCGYSIDLVVSRTEKSAQDLASSVSAAWSTEAVFPQTSTVIIVAVPDQSLSAVLQNISCSVNTIVAHTAGSYGVDIFPEMLKRKGVFYPLQTFSAGREINFNEVPILLESDDEETRKVLQEIGLSISNRTEFVTTERRRWIHLAAVFACNFTNHMLTAGYDIASKSGVGDDILKPLIRETVAKAMEAGPSKSQTGPAFRNDLNTIQKHLELLSSNPALRDLYSYITSSIIEYYKIK